MLTDDHAPIELLTDRLLGRLEDRVLATDEWRADAIRRLLARQRNLLLLIGLGWLVIAVLAAVLWRRPVRYAP